MPKISFDKLTKREKAVMLLNELFDRYPEEDINIDHYLLYEDLNDGGKLIAIEQVIEVKKRF